MNPTRKEFIKCSTPPQPSTIELTSKFNLSLLLSANDNSKALTMNRTQKHHSYHLPTTLWTSIEILLRQTDAKNLKKAPTNNDGINIGINSFSFITLSPSLTTQHTHDQSNHNNSGHKIKTQRWRKLKLVNNRQFLF